MALLPHSSPAFCKPIAYFQSVDALDFFFALWCQIWIIILTLHVILGFSLFLISTIKTLSKEIGGYICIHGIYVCTPNVHESSCILKLTTHSSMLSLVPVDSICASETSNQMKDLFGLAIFPFVLPMWVPWYIKFQFLPYLQIYTR